MSDDIAHLLDSLGLSQHLSLFVDNEVDLDTARILTDGDLEQLGLPFGPRKKLLHALAPPSIAAETAIGQRERRHLTVMFCDMVDFTVLASRLDPEVLEAVVRAYEDTCAASIAHYGGYVFARLGDGIIGFFGYPHAHEREAERAIRAGLEIQERLSVLDVPPVGRVQARVGIASGVVLVSPADQTATGDTMNMAARLQTVAPVGAVAVSGRVHQLAGDVFEYGDMGHLVLKGIAEPVHTYLVDKVRDLDSWFAATAGAAGELVGRGAEVDLLVDAWRTSRLGRGSVVCVIGEAGIGKSRLVAELRGRAEADGGVTIVVQCSPYHEHSAYHPVAEALRRLVALEPGAPADVALDALDRVCERYGRAADVGLLAGVMGLPFEHRYGAIDAPPRELKDRTVAALTDLIAAVGGEQPTLLLVEDLHWADPSTLGVLDVLVGRVAPLGVLVVTTQRPEAPRRWGDGPTVRTIEIGRLSDDEGRRIVDLLAGSRLVDDTIDLIVGRADGIPLFVEELTRAVLDRASDVVANAVAAEVQALPHTLRDLLAARLDGLGPAKELAQLGSVIGRDVPIDLLATISDLDAGSIAELLDQLHRSGLAVRQSDARGTWFTFKHALVRDAAYEGMTRARRQELHGRLADALVVADVGTQPEIVAQHLVAAGREAEAVPHWREAGRSALRRFALAEAVAHFGAGLALIGALPAGPERDLDELQLRSELAPALVAVRGWAAPDVAALLTPAVPLARQLGHHDSLLPVLHGLWVHHMSAAEHAVAVGWAQQLLDAATEHDDEVLELCGHRSLMTSNFWQGDLAASLAHGDRIRERYDVDRHRHIAELTNADPLTADGSYRCQSLWVLGFPDQARAVSDEKDEFARRRNHPFDLCFALTIGALAFDYRGEPDALLARVDEAVRVGREHRVPLMSEMMAQIIVGIAWLRQGRVSDSVEQISSSLARLRGTGHRAWVPYVHAVLGEARALDGDVAGGLAEAESAVSLMRDRGELVHLPEALRIAGWIRCRSGDIAAGEAVLRESLDLAERQGARSWSLRTATTLAPVLAARGEAAEAWRLVSSLLASFTEGADTADHRRAHDVLRSLIEPEEAST